MSDSQESYINRYPVENIYPHSIELPDIVTRMSREITRNATFLIKMITLIQLDKVPTTNHNYTINRISTKLLNQLTLWEAHWKADQEEHQKISDELQDARLRREELITKKVLRDISDEECSLRLSIADWSIKDLSEKKASLENNLKAYTNLKGLPLLVDINELYKMSKNDFFSLNSLGLEYETLKQLKRTLYKLLQTTTDKTPSTL